MTDRKQARNLCRAFRLNPRHPDLAAQVAAEVARRTAAYDEAAEAYREAGESDLSTPAGALAAKQAIVWLQANLDKL